MTGKDAMLLAFDRLFDKAADKLHIVCTIEEKEEARRGFANRFSGALDVASQITMETVPDEVMRLMEDAINSLSPQQVVAQLASIPLIHQTQEMIRSLTYRAAEQRLLDHLISQTDDRYGGN